LVFVKGLATEIRTLTLTLSQREREPGVGTVLILTAN
jgi:hypothetical protein